MDENILIVPLVVRFLTSRAATINKDQHIYIYIYVCIILSHMFRFTYRSRPVALMVYRLLFGSHESTAICRHHFAQRADKSYRVSRE